MLKEVKEVKEDMMIMSHQIENINKETEIVKRNQTKILELKNTITEFKNSLERFHSTTGLAEERISKPENKTIKIIKSKEQKEKKNEEKVNLA